MRKKPQGHTKKWYRLRMLSSDNYKCTKGAGFKKFTDIKSDVKIRN